MRWKKIHQDHYKTPQKTWEPHYSTWESLFLFDGFQEMDVVEAVEEMVKVVPGPALPDGHYDWILKFLVTARENLRRKHEVKKMQERAAHACQNCKGVGIVVGLPHPDCTKHGAWEPRTDFVDYVCCSVYCDCPYGLERHANVLRWWAEHRRGESEPLNLVQYERIVPDWRAMLQGRADKIKAEMSLRPPAPRAQKGPGGKLGLALGAGPYGDWTPIEAPEWEPQPGEGARQ